MLEPDDAMKVMEAVTKDLAGVARNPQNFRRLPDTYWGYFARGHDGKGTFAVIVTYSEKGEDVDALLRSYEEWAARNKVK